MIENIAISLMIKGHIIIPIQTSWLIPAFSLKEDCWGQLTKTNSMYSSRLHLGSNYEGLINYNALE